MKAVLLKTTLQSNRFQRRTWRITTWCFDKRGKKRSKHSSVISLLFYVCKSTSFSELSEGLGQFVGRPFGQALVRRVCGLFKVTCIFSLLIYLPIYFRSIDPPHHDRFYSSGPSCSKADKRLDPGFSDNFLCSVLELLIINL